MVCRYALVERQTQIFSPAVSLVLDPGVPVTSIRKPAGGFSFARKRKLSEIEKGRQFYQNYRPDMAEREGFEPSRRYYRPTGIRSQTLQPLGYLSTASVILTHSRSLHNSKMLVFDDVEALMALPAAFYFFLFLRALFLRSRTSPRSRIRAIRIPTIRVVRFET